MKRGIYGIVLLGAIGLISCKKQGVISAIPNGYEFGEELPIGLMSVHDASSYAFSHQIKGVSSQEHLDFFVGNSFFNDVWVEAPSSTTARDGLGPLFNARACSACHFKDGRGAPFFNEGLLIRLSGSQTDVNGNYLPETTYGGQLQEDAIGGVNKEGQVIVTYVEIAGTYPDGTAWSIRKPTYSFSGLNYGAMGNGIMTSPRVGQQLIGLGFLELVPEGVILANADPNDADGDGISGRVNYLWEPLTQTYSLGRFGWKANVATLKQQVAGAFNGDIGITTSLFPNQNHTALQSSLDALPNGGSPELPDEDLEKVVLYCQTLAVPIRRDYYNATVIRGKHLFNDLQCARCHLPEMKTGGGGNIQALRNIVIRPYTDLLLHDMGPGLADYRPDGMASGLEWRTQPLWGLGLIQKVNGHSYLLHDGRARTIEEAILWHGGEAEQSKLLFMQLAKNDRNAILAFLNSL